MWRPFFSASADLGGRGGRRCLRFLSIGAALLLLLTSPPAGRGGEGLEVRMGVIAAGGNPRSSSSNGGGVVEASAKVTPAWCRGLPGSDLEAPSSNKLLAGWILDLGLESPLTPSPSSPQVLLCVVPVLLTGRGGEGKNGDNMSRPWWSPWARDVKGIPSPGAVTSSARGPVLPAALERNGFASYPGGLFEHSPRRRFLLHVAILCLPPPVRGRFWESDGRTFLLGGVGEESASTFPVHWTGSWKTTLSSLCLTARAYRLVAKAIRPIKLPVKDSGMSSTSIRRPLLRSAAVAFVGSEASGFVPASVLDGGSSGFWLDGGERGGSICFLYLSERSFLPLPGSYVLFLYFMGSLIITCTSTAYF
jgi:hypothetical protein